MGCHHLLRIEIRKPFTLSNQAGTNPTAGWWCPKCGGLKLLEWEKWKKPSMYKKHKEKK